MNRHAKKDDNGATIDAQKFIDDYSAKYQELYYASALAEWKSNTEIREDDSTNEVATRKANQAVADFTGSVENIEAIQKLLKREDLTPIQRKQLDAMLYGAANQPATVKEKVAARIKAETDQTKALFGFDFKIDGESVSPNDIDSILRGSSDMEARTKAWEASKEVGKELKSGLVNLRNLRNETVQALDYPDYFTYQVSEYGMTTAEMNEMMLQLCRDIWPMYRELHTYARYELAQKYVSASTEFLIH